MIQLMQQWLDASLVETVGWTLVHFVWQGAAVAMLLAGVLAILRRRPPAARYLAACLALGAMALSPAMTLAYLAHRHALAVASASAFVRPAAAEQPMVSSAEFLSGMGARPGDDALLAGARIPSAPNQAQAQDAPASSLADRVRPALPWCVSGWVLGVLALSARLAGGWVRLLTIKREASAAPGEWAARLPGLSQRLHIARPVALLAAARVEVPCVLGWLKPIILVPAGMLCGLSGQQIEAILAHELAHIRRRDYLINLLQSVLEALLFYHPAVWWVSRRIRVEREHCCDDIAAEACGSAVQYARALTALEQMRSAPASLAPAASGGQLLPRIRRLLGLPEAGAAGHPWAGMGITLAAIVLTLLVLSHTRIHGKAAKPEGIEAADVDVAAAITGTVLTADGKPVANARVSRVIASKENPMESVTAATVRSGADGAFRLEVPKMAGGCGLFVEAEGYAANSASVPTLDQTPAGPIHVPAIRVNPAVTLRVQVLGPDGRPVAGLRVAPVRFHDRRPMALEGGWHLTYPIDAQDRLARQTDADGVLTLSDLPAQAALHLRIDDERFARLTWENRILTGGEAVTIAPPLRLMAAATVHGRVVYSDTGKPAAGITISAQSAKPHSTGWGKAVTDERGEYYIKQLPAGQFNALVRLPTEAGLASWTAAAIEGLEVVEGQSRGGIDFKLIKGGVLTGKVVMQDTGKGVPGISVGLQGPSRPRSGGGIQHTLTGPDGSFSFRVPPGSQHVYVAQQAPDGYLRPKPVEPEVADGQTVPVTIELWRDLSPPVAGRVVDADGQPVAEAVVMADPAGSHGSMPRLARTDKEGRFRFAAIPPGSLLRVRKGDLSTAEAFETKGEETDLTLRVRKGARVSLIISVVDTEDKPVKGARVRMIVWTGESGSGSVDPIRTTDDRGRCILPELVTDFRYSFTADADGCNLGTTSWVQPKPGQENTARIVLRRAAP